MDKSGVSNGGLLGWACWGP